MTEQTARDVLWAHTDEDKDTGRLQAGPSMEGDPRPGAVAHLCIGPEQVDLDRDAVRRLRNACDRILDDDGVPTETGGRQATLEGAYALHAAQHRQLEATARHIARQVDYQATALARLADSEPSLSLTVHTILDVHRRTVASLGDLLAALVGGP